MISEKSRLGRRDYRRMGVCWRADGNELQHKEHERALERDFVIKAFVVCWGACLAFLACCSPCLPRIGGCLVHLAFHAIASELEHTAVRISGKRRRSRAHTNTLTRVCASHHRWNKAMR
jgi:hypothetical protein